MKRTSIHRFVTLLLLTASLVPQMLFAFLPSESDNPAANSRLFIIARSKNANIVCYDLNYLSAGKIDPEKPIHVYWYNQTDNPGAIDELSYIQAKLAYGYSSVKTGNDQWEISLVAFPQRKLVLEKVEDGSFRSRLMISGRQANLKKIFVQADPNNSFKVRWVDLYGTDIQNGKEIKERIYP